MTVLSVRVHFHNISIAVPLWCPSYSKLRLLGRTCNDTSTRTELAMGPADPYCTINRGPNFPHTLNQDPQGGLARAARRAMRAHKDHARACARLYTNPRPGGLPPAKHRRHRDQPGRRRPRCNAKLKAGPSEPGQQGRHRRGSLLGLRAEAQAHATCMLR